MTDQEMFKFFIKMHYKDERFALYRTLSELQRFHFGDQYGKGSLIKKLQKSGDLRYISTRMSTKFTAYRINF